MTISTGKKIGILIESLYDAHSLQQAQEIFAIAGHEVIFLSYLWGHTSLTFHSEDRSAYVTVTRDVQTENPADYAGLIILDGYSADRLRYQKHPVCGGPNLAPAIEFLQRARPFVQSGQLKIGSIGHGLWLFCSMPDWLKGLHVTCTHSIISDVINAGGIVLFNNDQIADMHQDTGVLTARDAGVAGPFMAYFATQV